MQLSLNELKGLYFGAYSFAETEDGYLQSFQFTQEQMDYFQKTSNFWYDRCRACSAKTIEFLTKAEGLSFEYKILWKGSDDSFEVAVDGLPSQIWYVKDMAEEGRIDCRLPGGEKSVVLYLPVDATVLIRGFEITGNTVRPHKEAKVLWLGDSITQGYGPLRSAQSYVSVANRLLNYDVLNQGIGGYVYDRHSLMRMDGYMPDKIIVAFGTNQYMEPSMRAVEEYYEALISLYGIQIPVLCITPIWRGDALDTLPKLKRFCENTQSIASQYSNVLTVDGFELVPHLPEYYLDGLHPNSLGAEVYGRNLAAFIRASGF